MLISTVRKRSDLSAKPLRMKILVEISPELNQKYKAFAKERDVPVGSVYEQTLFDAMDSGLVATLGQVRERKERSDKGVARGPRVKPATDAQ